MPPVLRVATESERKFLVTTAELKEFLAATVKHLRHEVRDPRRPLAYTRTLYLDTADGRYSRLATSDASTSVCAERLRLRQYAVGAPGIPPLILDPCYLELKETLGDERRKRRVAAPASVIARLLARRGDGAAAAGGAPFGPSGPLSALARRLEEERVAPRLVTWYRRDTFVAAGGVRVTLDEELLFSPPSPVEPCGREPLLVGPLVAGPPRVLEVKCEGDLPAWLVRAITGLPVQPPFSKFCMGLAAIGLDTRPPAFPPP